MNIQVMSFYYFLELHVHRVSKLWEITLTNDIVLYILTNTQSIQSARIPGGSMS